jgi:hypothetical protein
MKIYVQYIYENFLLKFFLEREFFFQKVVEEIKTYISCSMTYFPKIVLFM